MQLGFVIDHSRCIGCHACTVACKAENDVPLGKFRTWVKYTEQGAFPEVRRSFAVLRCNQCTDAPCVTICPVRALEKRPDGIVDVDPAACIGCKACLQGCPYDALYLNESSGTVGKCHFCAHRTEIGLAPACAVVCPTEAIIPGDFHDPGSVVSRMRQDDHLQARKTEAGTGPNVFYKEVAEPGIDPLLANAASGYLWANQVEGDQLAADRFQAMQEDAETQAQARTTYNVDHPSPWGWRVSAYLFTKSMAAGIFLAIGFLFNAKVSAGSLAWISLGSLVFLLITAGLLVADLKRPERFYTILTRPNWSSWLVRGTWVLTAFGLLATLLTAMLFLSDTAGAAAHAVWALGAVPAALTAGYTGWLFGQAKGRVLWMRRGLWLHLMIQALVSGCAAVILIGPWLDLTPAAMRLLVLRLQTSLILHLLFIWTEGWMSPPKREKEFRRALRLITSGPFAARHYGFGLGLGVAFPLLVTVVSGMTTGPSSGLLSSVAALAVLIGLYVEENLLVRAGQALPIS